jgi:hypothetical protein
MGHLDDPLNTFWQLFYRPTADSSWALVTPPGVADNGGLVMSTGMLPTVTVGFEPSQNLHFSPLAVTTDHGNTWSPGIVSDGLSPDPDVLAGSDAGTSFAVVGSDGGRVLETASDANTWRTLVSRSILARTDSGAACGVGELTAVTVDPLGHPLIGTTCTHDDRVGLFAGHADDWSFAGPRLPDQPDVMGTRVLRLVTTSSDVSSLLDLNTRTGPDIVADWSRDGQAPWSVSPSLLIGLRRQIISTAVGDNGGFLVEVANNNKPPSLLAIPGPATNWRTMTPAPQGTETVVANPNGAIDALSVRNSQLTVWVLASASGSWMRQQVIDVPIDYGSSN